MRQQPADQVDAHQPPAGDATATGSEPTGPLETLGAQPRQKLRPPELIAEALENPKQPSLVGTPMTLSRAIARAPPGNSSSRSRKPIGGWPLRRPAITGPWRSASCSAGTPSPTPRTPARKACGPPPKPTCATLNWKSNRRRPRWRLWWAWPATNARRWPPIGHTSATIGLTTKAFSATGCRRRASGSSSALCRCAAVPSTPMPKPSSLPSTRSKPPAINSAPRAKASPLCSTRSNCSSASGGRSSTKCGITTSTSPSMPLPSRRRASVATRWCPC